MSVPICGTGRLWHRLAERTKGGHSTISTRLYVGSAQKHKRLLHTPLQHHGALGDVLECSPWDKVQDGGPETLGKRQMRWVRSWGATDVPCEETENAGLTGEAGGEKIPLHLAKGALWGEGGMQDENEQEDKQLSLTLDPFTFHFCTHTFFSDNSTSFRRLFLSSFKYTKKKKKKDAQTSGFPALILVLFLARTCCEGATASVSLPWEVRPGLWAAGVWCDHREGVGVDSRAT